MAIAGLFLTADADDWAVAKEKNGVSVYTREVAGSDFLEFRGETVVEGSVSSLVALLYDTPNAPAWLHDCSFSMTVEEKAFEENVIFQTYDLPFPAGDRQVILRTKLVWSPKEARLETQEANGYCDGRQTERCDRTRRSGYITIERSRGAYTLTPLNAKRTKVVWQQHVEPGGMLPSWLANALVVDLPYHSLLQLRSLVRDEKYRDLSETQLRAMWLKEYRRYH